MIQELTPGQIGIVLLSLGICVLLVGIILVILSYGYVRKGPNEVFDKARIACQERGRDSRLYGRVLYRVEDLAQLFLTWIGLIGSFPRRGWPRKSIIEPFCITS